jgi:cation/acetate symporter
MATTEVQLLPLAIVGGMFFLLVLGGLGSKMRQASDYGFAGSYSGRMGSGAAIASNWMSAASIMGLAGLFYLKGYYAMAYVIGWTGGYVLLLVILASHIRRFGKFTAPDFVGFRYESETARTVAALISILISVVYCIAQFRGIALLVSWLFGMDYRASLMIGAALVVAFVVISGTLGVLRNQKLQYFVLIIAFILPLIFINKKLGYFWAIPQFGYGQAIVDLQTQFGFYWSEPFASVSLFQWLALCFSLMFGTAGLPHVLSRFYMAPSIRDARWGVVWGLFFISLIYWSAPAYGVLSRLLEARAGGGFGPVDINSVDMVIVTAALKGGVSVWIVGLLVAGGMAAAFYAVSGLLLNGAASFAYDIYPRLLKPGASDTDKVVVAKGFFLVLAAVVLGFSLRTTGMIAEIAAVAFALAGNTIFPAFLLGVWWRRANAAGVLAGMVAGVLITFSSFIFGNIFPVITRIFPVTASAFLGVPIVLAIMVAVSFLTRPPSKTMADFLAKEIHDTGAE